jgi:uncharacterized protein YbbC (DUF1343 family)
MGGKLSRLMNIALAVSVIFRKASNVQALNKLTLTGVCLLTFPWKPEFSLYKPVSASLGI